MNHHPDIATATPAMWTDLDMAGKIAAIRALALEGLTTTAMAARLGTTKNAVGGLAFRKRIALPQQANHMPFVPQRPAFPVHPPVPENTWEPLGPPVAAPNRKECCWPVGHDGGSAQMFCGLPRHRGSYCAEHADMAYRPAAAVNPADFEQQNELLRFLRDSEIKETARVAFGRVGGERGDAD